MGMTLLRAPKWAACAKEIVDTAFVPKLKPKPGALFVSGVIGMGLMPANEDTPDHPTGLPLRQKLATPLNIESDGNPWHFTLAYCRNKDEFEAADKAQVEVESAAIEAAIFAARPPGGEPFPMGPARLCRFEDMTAFVPWDGFMV